MVVTFLGTGTSQGVPVIACKCNVCISHDTRDKRLRSSVLIEDKGTTILIDSGPDFRQQMLHEKVEDLAAILFTHEHRDHIAGLDDVRAFNFINKKPVDIYAEKRVADVIESEFSYAFGVDKYPGVPELDIHVITGDAFHVNDMKITPIRMFHYKLPVYGFRIGDFAYLTDANSISAEEKKKLQGIKHLVVGAVRKEPHISHFSLSEAIKLIAELNPLKGYITHISHQMGTACSNEADLPGQIMFAYDGLKLHV